MGKLKRPTTRRSRSLQAASDRYRYATPDKNFVVKKKFGHQLVFELADNAQPEVRNDLWDRYAATVQQQRDYEPTPFIYDRPVVGSDLLDRQQEIGWALSQILNKSLALLYAPSGFGKTSVALALKEALSKNENYAVGYVSFRDATNEWEVVKRYVEAMYAALGVPDYRWGIINKSNFHSQLMLNVYDLPTLYAKRLGKKLVAIMDDFEAIFHLPHAHIIEAHFRNAWIETPNRMDISAIVFQDINQDTTLYMYRKRALALSADGNFFERISTPSWYRYVQTRLANQHKLIDESAIQYLIERMNHIPRKIQQLCHHLSLSKSKSITKKVIDLAIEKILDKVSFIYEVRLGYLPKLQQAVLFSMAEGRKVDVLASRRQGVNKMLDEFVYYHGDEWLFRDPFFEAFILKRNKLTSKTTKKSWEQVAGTTAKLVDFDSDEWKWE